MEVGAANDLEARLTRRGGQLAAGVPPAVTEAHVVFTPHPRVRGHGDDDHASAIDQTSQRAERGDIVVEMLDEIESRDRSRNAVAQGNRQCRPPNQRMLGMRP